MLSLNSALTLLINFAHLFSKYCFLYFHLTISGFNRCNHLKLRDCIKMLKVLLLAASISASVWVWLALISRIWSSKRWTAPVGNWRRILPVERWMPLRSTWKELLMWRMQHLLTLHWPTFVYRWWRTLPGLCRSGLGLAFALGKGGVQHAQMQM